MRQFLMHYKQAIENNPLQLYASALIFSPIRSLTVNLFKEEQPKWITINQGLGDQWDACLQTLEGHSGKIRSIVFSHGCTRLASTSGDSTVKIWDLSSGECQQTLKDQSGEVRLVAFLCDSTQLASVSFGGVIKIWDISSGKYLQTL
jgi:WD40 repeat protein